MKKKLVSGIVTGILALGLFVVGVYAAIKASMTFSGGVGFNPQGVYVELSGQVYRGKDYSSLEPVYEKPSYTLKKVSNYSEDEVKKIDGWKAEDVAFTPLYRYVQYQVTIKNLSDSDISVVPGDIAGVPSTVTATEEASDTLRISPSEEKIFKLNFYLSDTTKSFTNNSWGLVLEIMRTDDIETNASSYSISSSKLNSLSSTSYSTSKFGKRVLKVPDTITSMADGTQSAPIFKNLQTETKYIILPTSLTNIGAYAFYGSIIRGINFPKSLVTIGNNAFNACKSLTSAAISEGTTTLQDRAFYFCSAMISVKIPSTVTSIAYTSSVFGGCSALEDIDISAANATYYSGTTNAVIEKASQRLIYGCKSTVVPDGVVTIGYSSFDNINTLPAITFPDSVTSIEQYAFWRCTGLKTINTNKTKTLGIGAFIHCQSLETVTLGESIETISYNAFSDCISLKTINILKTTNPTLTGPLVTHDALEAVYAPYSVVTSTPNYWYSIENVIYTEPMELTSGQYSQTNGLYRPSSSYLGSHTYYDVYFTLDRSDMTATITSPGSNAWSSYSSQPRFIVVPREIIVEGERFLVTAFADGAFKNSPNLFNITIPNTIKNIAANTFSSCPKLEVVKFSNKTVSIGANAFLNCTSLSIVSLPKSVTSVASDAFYNCSSLEKVIFKSSAPPDFKNSGYFPASTNIYVPFNSLNSYKSASNFGSFSNSIRSFIPMDSESWKMNDYENTYRNWYHDEYFDNQMQVTVYGTSGCELRYIPISVTKGTTYTIMFTYTMPTLTADYFGYGAGRIRAQILSNLTEGTAYVGSQINSTAGSGYYEMLSNSVQNTATMTFMATATTTYYFALNFGFGDDSVEKTYLFSNFEIYAGLPTDRSSWQVLSAYAQYFKTWSRDDNSFTTMINGGDGFENRWLVLSVQSGKHYKLSFNYKMPSLSANYGGIGAGRLRAQVLTSAPGTGTNIESQINSTSGSGYYDMLSNASGTATMTFTSSRTGTYYFCINFGFGDDGVNKTYSFSNFQFIMTN